MRLISNSDRKFILFKKFSLSFKLPSLFQFLIQRRERFPGIAISMNERKKIVVVLFFPANFWKNLIPKKIMKKTFFLLFLLKPKTFLFLNCFSIFFREVPFFISDARNFIEGALPGTLGAPTTL